MLDRKISTTVAALACAAGAALAAPAAYSAPCGITGVTSTDVSPIKTDAGTIARELVKRRGETKNVGQEVAFRARLEGDPTGTLTYRWFIEGEVIDDYVESPAERTPEGRPETEATANPFRVVDHVEIDRDGLRGAAFEARAADFIQFYWRMEGIALPARVLVALDVLEQHGEEAPHVCATDDKVYTVERNQDDRESQPEDFYVEINHGARVLSEHVRWHGDHKCCEGYDGRLFPVFHTRFLANYSAFRRTFGYPQTVDYIPPAVLPTRESGYTVEHTPVNKDPRTTDPTTRFGGNTSGFVRPTWSTLAGGEELRPRIDGSDCTPRTIPFPRRQRLAEFPTLAELGCALENPWHNMVHPMVGGDMASFESPRDPIFFRWHGYVNSVFLEFPNAPAGVISASAPTAPVASAAQARRGRFCNGLSPTVRGTSGADRLRGTRRADVIWGGGGRDRIAGLAGNDIICGGRGDDRLNGGRGFDTIHGGGGRDRIVGGRDGDHMEGGARRDRISGGAGTDVVFGGGGPDRMDGGGDNEWILDGGAGNDRIDGSTGVDNLHGGPGDDRLDGGAGPDTLDGGAGADTMDGGSGVNTVLYLDAPDGVNVDLGEGTATGEGRDRLEGFDRVHGSSEADTIEGGSGDETIIGGEGNDDITGGGGEDALHGGTGNDDVGGGRGDDYCAAEEDASRCED
jgi:RTX calcium-binding nonapeptide repeat (4 copies)/Common central domain of tyrosinase